MIKNFLQTLIWLIPASSGKNKLLTKFGHSISPSAYIAPNLVFNVQHVSAGPRSSIGPTNVIRNMKEIWLSEASKIGSFNVISSHPVYQRLYANGATLVLRANSSITSWHQLDAAGGIQLGGFACLGGSGSKILTHSIDLRLNVQAAYPVTIGRRTFVDSSCLILGGAVLPESSFFGVGTVVPHSSAAKNPGHWSGNPAKRTGDAEGNWYNREDEN
ncbi:acyltransferase [Arthrobacter sp.]|uniref:acyltransferase n=1 Tax=Arthrobacter sp. TaxID=1667 RepID=UPI003A8D2825